MNDSAIAERTPNGDDSARTTTATSDENGFEERLRAVERAVTGTDSSLTDVSDGATAAAEREEIESRLDDVEARVEELEAATQALRGYVGSIRAVNREVERRADLALARASGGGDAVAETSVGREMTATHGGDEVPTEAALDAAVPSEAHGETGQSSAGQRAAQARDTDGKIDSRGDDPSDEPSDDGSWRSGALDRLRESL